MIMHSNRQSRSILYTVLIGLVIAVAIAAVVWMSKRGDDSSSAKVFCGPDGKLVNTPATQSHRSYCVRAYSPLEGLQPNVPLDISFDIVDDRGHVLREFQTVHEKTMHVIVVRHDLTQFQHVHPTFVATNGRFTVERLVLPSAGPYRLFADFTPSGAMGGPDGQPLPVTVPVDLGVGDSRPHEAQPLPVASDSAVAGEYEATLARPDTLRAGEEARLTFTIRRGGQVVPDLEPYLGANGHAVVLREGNLTFIHSHALEDSAALRAGQLPFMVHFGEPGRYRMFVQFRHQGEVQTAAFTMPTVIDATSDSTAAEHSGH